MTITGSGFSDTKADVTVKFYKVVGGVQYTEFVHCNVTASTTTSITCNLLGGPSGEYNTVVEVGTNGNTTYTTKVKLALEIESITPTSGSKLGGTLLEIKG
jgi:hypothetical protein